MITLYACSDDLIPEVAETARTWDTVSLNYTVSFKVSTR